MEEGIERADVKRHQKAEEKRARHKNSSILHPTPQPPPPPTSCAPCAVQTATRALADKATQDVAPLWIDKGAQACLSRLQPTTTNLQRPTFIMEVQLNRAKMKVKDWVTL